MITVAPSKVNALWQKLTKGTVKDPVGYYAFKFSAKKLSNTRRRYRYEFYFSGGKLHREGGPAFAEHTRKSKPLAMYWYRHGLLHRDHNYAVFRQNSTVFGLAFYQDNILHNYDGPAIIRRCSRQDEYHIYWYQKGEFHNNNGVAYLRKYGWGFIDATWARNGKIISWWNPHRAACYDRGLECNRIGCTFVECRCVPRVITDVLPQPIAEEIILQWRSNVEQDISLEFTRWQNWVREKTALMMFGAFI